jgi:DNA ligase-1
MKIFDSLYARNSNGKINVWEVIAKEISTVKAGISISEGDFDGRKSVTWRDCKPKNVGKMNATTPYEQACSEAEARFVKKQKQGYKTLEILGIDSVNDLETALPMNRTDANDISKPMKAQPYYKTKTVDGKLIKTNEPRISFPCFGQPKLNGFRVMARWETVKEGEGIFAQEVEKVVFRSKEGLRYDILEHIEIEFTKEMFFLEHGFEDGKLVFNDELVFDGEMYIHGEILSEISSAVRKRNDKTKLLQFHIFDIAIEKLPQKERNTILYNLPSSKTNNYCKIGSIRIESNERAQAFTDECIKKGYEGAIFRDMKATYQFGKRPQTMVKLKRSEDKEFVIKDVIGGDNTPDLGIFVCIAENGETFKVTPEGTDEKKRKYLSNKLNYIGKQLTVRFFERTITGVPFHAIGVVRDYE